MILLPNNNPLNLLYSKLYHLLTKISLPFPKILTISGEIMDYKDSLLLPKTSFPMRGNLPEKEPKKFAEWYKQDVYEKMKKNREDSEESFTLHDGPPYANGNIHIGHALNKILKDIIVKHHYFSGKKVRFTPGWDCHGLPIEQKVEEKIGKEKKKTLAKSKIREICRKHARKFIDIQRNEFKRLGVIADWEKPYLTMDFKFEANIYRELCEIAKKGLLIERSKPVHWSWAAQTALAEAEIEYKDKISPSIFVAFILNNSANQKIGTDEAKIIIWTTTPWTLPANTGISINPEEEYVLTSDNFIVAKKLYEQLIEKEVISGTIEKAIDPKILENEFAINPLNGRESKVLLGEHVAMDTGTGAVHTAPGHGEDDYRIGLRYDLEVVMPVDSEGNFDFTVEREKLLPNPQEFIGMNVFSANDKILELLGENLLKKEDIKHSYPHCWRTHKPVIFRATNQWFIAMDKEFGTAKKTLRNLAMDEIKKVSFYPPTGENRLNLMVEGRPDWCISRQRDWGVPIAFFRDKISGKIIFDEKVLNFIAMVFDQKGCDAWYDLPVQDLLHPASGYNPENLEKVMDILDVWFDSGSTQRAVMRSRNYDSGDYPVDMYLEGSDQHRGWFQSSLLVASATTEKAPYKSVLTHGFALDSKGNKMSKSQGNVIAPIKIANQYGVEIIRLWIATSDYTTDLKIGDPTLKQLSESYRKLRNTFRFLLANITDLEKLLPIDELNSLDMWILEEANKTFAEIEQSFDSYDFSRGFSALTHFITVPLSGIYMDISKDSLYCDGKNSPERKSIQTVMAMILKKLMQVTAPILTYTIDEVLAHSPQIIKENMKDVFDLNYVQMQKIDSGLDSEYLMKARESFYEIIDNLKKEKIIKNTLELVIFTESQKAKALGKSLEDWFVVSKIIKDKEDGELASFEIANDKFYIYKSSQAKCPRCWKFKSENEENLCKRCEEVVNG